MPTASNHLSSNIKYCRARQRRNLNINAGRSYYLIVVTLRISLPPPLLPEMYSKQLTKRHAQISASNVSPALGKRISASLSVSAPSRFPQGADYRARRSPFSESPRIRRIKLAIRRGLGALEWGINASAAARLISSDDSETHACH